jgi:hypothetical protein
VLGIKPCGEKEVLGLWIEQSEGAKFWLKVMNDLKNRGVADILIAVVDGLKGFPEAIGSVFPPHLKRCPGRSAFPLPPQTAVWSPRQQPFPPPSRSSAPAPEPPRSPYHRADKAIEHIVNLLVAASSKPH